MELEQLATIDDEALDEVSGGHFGMGWVAGAVLGGIVAGVGLIGFGVGVAAAAEVFAFCRPKK